VEVFVSQFMHGTEPAIIVKRVLAAMCDKGLGVV
jgi:hypothetical protein